MGTLQQISAKLKGLLRTTAAHTVPDLWHTIRQAVARFTADECRNCIAATCYDADLAVAPSADKALAALLIEHPRDVEPSERHTGLERRAGRDADTTVFAEKFEWLLHPPRSVQVAREP